MGIFNDNIHNPHSSGSTQGPVGPKGPPGPGFKFTRDGNFNVDGKRLTNVGAPTDDDDTTTKKYVDDGMSGKVSTDMVMTLGRPEGEKIVRYLPNPGGEQKNVGLITPKLYIEDEFNDSVILQADDQDYDDVHLYIPNLKNYDGIDGRRKSNIMVNSINNTMTGKIILPSGNLMIKDGVDFSVLNREDINKILGSQSNGNGIIPDKVPLYASHGTIYANSFAVKNENDHDFVILRCRDSSGLKSLYIPSLNSDADIVINQTNQTINGDKTFSSAITMTQEGSVNNHLVTKGYVDSHSTNENYLKVDGSNMMTGDLNMNEQRVKNTLDPSDEQDTVNKRYLESQLTDYLKRDSQPPMTFNLNMDNYKIVNLNEPTLNSDATTKKYVDDEIAKIPSSGSDFLKKDGSIAMTGDLNMATNKIKNLGTPSTHEDDAAVNVEFFNSELNASNHSISRQITTAYKKYVNESHISSQEHFQKNAFLYLMEDVDESSSENNISVIGIISYAPSIHQMNKKAYQLTLNKDLGSTNYRSRIGFNLGSLNIGYYTFVCEFIPPTMTNVSVTASGTTINITKQATKTFPTYTKTLVQFHRWNSTPPQFIYIDLHGSTPDNSPTAFAFMVVYGVEGYFPNVPSSVFDQVYVVDNGRMVMQTELDLNGYPIRGTLNYSSNNIVMLKKIDMNNQKIINVALGTDDNDVVNKKQMENNLKYYVHGEINIGQNTFLLNGFNAIIMPYRYITSIFFVYKTYNSSNSLQNLPRIGIKIEAGNSLNLITSSTGISQQIIINQTMTQSILSVELTRGPIQNGLSRDKILMLIELSFH